MLRLFIAILVEGEHVGPLLLQIFLVHTVVAYALRAEGDLLKLGVSRDGTDPVARMMLLDEDLRGLRHVYGRLSNNYSILTLLAAISMRLISRVVVGVL